MIINQKAKKGCLNIEFKKSALTENDAKLQIVDNSHIVIWVSEVSKKLLTKIGQKMHKIVHHVDSKQGPFGLKYYLASELTIMKIQTVQV